MYHVMEQGLSSPIHYGLATGYSEGHDLALLGTKSVHQLATVESLLFVIKFSPALTSQSDIKSVIAIDMDAGAAILG